MTKEITEKIKFDGKMVTMTWFESSHFPPGEMISQVSAFCFQQKSKSIVVVRNKHGWGLPGGHPKKGESVIETLVRELKEEAAVSIADPKLVGYVKVLDPYNSGVEGKSYIQLRYFAEVVKVEKFNKNQEIFARKFIKVEDIPLIIKWMQGGVGGAQLESFRRIFDL